MEEPDTDLEVVAPCFSVTAEPTRLKIMPAICQDEKSVNGSVEAVGATHTNVSRRLRLMYRTGVVTQRKDGSRVFYRIADRATVEICRTVCTQIAGRIDDHPPLRGNSSCGQRVQLESRPRRRTMQQAHGAGSSPQRRISLSPRQRPGLQLTAARNSPTRRAVSPDTAMRATSSGPGSTKTPAGGTGAWGAVPMRPSRS